MGGEAVKQKCTPFVEEEGVLYVLGNTFRCKALIPYTVVFGDDFHYCFHKTFAKIIFLSLIYFTVLFSMKLLTRYLNNIPVRNRGGGVRWVRVRTQWRGCKCVRWGVGSQIFAILVRAY